MKKVLSETVSDMLSSMHTSHEVQKNDLFELQDDVSAFRSQKKPKTHRVDGVVIGVLVGIKDSGEPLVDFPTNTSVNYLPARSTVAIGKSQIGQEVVLLFEKGDLQLPIVVGLIQHPERVQSSILENTRSKKQNPVEVEVDGERLVFTAKKEIILRCGNASITLTCAGKVLIRGAYLLSRSSGVNRIKGGSVQIN